MAEKFEQFFDLGEWVSFSRLAFYPHLLLGLDD